MSKKDPGWNVEENSTDIFQKDSRQSNILAISIHFVLE